MVRVLIADDHALVRRGLRDLLDPLSDVEVVGEVTTGTDVQAAVADLRPDVLMLDVSMPGTNFIDLLTHLREHVPRLQTLVLSAHAEAMYARRAIRAGAAGYITKSSVDADLVAAVRAVATGGRYISSELAQELAGDIATGRPTDSHHLLTNREHQVMLLIAGGHTVTAIAEQLGLSVKTVSTHRTRILAKMRLATNADLVRYALTNRLID